MRNSRRVYIYLLMMLFASVVGASNAKIDSLINLINSTPTDTVKVKLLNELSGELLDRSSYDSAQLFSNKAIQLCKKQLKITTGIELKNSISRSLANAYGNAAIALMSLSEYPKAVDNFFMAMKLVQELKDTSQIIRYWGNIGAVFNSQEDYNTALEYYFKALALLPEGNLNSGEKRKLTAILGNIGTAYRDLKQIRKALEYYQKALGIAEQQKLKPFQSTILGNIGIAYQKLGDSIAVVSGHEKESSVYYSNAKNNYFAALKIDEEINNKNGIARHLGNIGQFYIEQKKYEEAEGYLLKALTISTDIGSLNLLKDEHHSLSDCYMATGKDKLALVHYRQYVQLRDSILDQEGSKKVARAAIKFEFDKKEALLNAEHEKERALAEADSKKQYVIIISVVAGFVLVLFFSGFLFRALRVTRKQKFTIEKQKILVEEKQTEILDSIRYAKRIQQSLLPTEKYIDKNLKRIKKQNDGK